MLAICATIAALTPLLAIGLGGLGWVGILPILFLVGATSNGRGVGFSSVLLELAPPDERPTYSALNTWLMLPAAFLPLAAGALVLSCHLCPDLRVCWRRGRAGVEH